MKMEAAADISNVPLAIIKSHPFSLVFSLEIMTNPKMVPRTPIEKAADSNIILL